MCIFRWNTEVHSSPYLAGFFPRKTAVWGWTSLSFLSPEKICFPPYLPNRAQWPYLSFKNMFQFGAEWIKQNWNANPHCLLSLLQFSLQVCWNSLCIKFTDKQWSFRLQTKAIYPLFKMTPNHYSDLKLVFDLFFHLLCLKNCIHKN